MRTFDDLVRAASEAGVRLSVDTSRARTAPADLDFVFHVPLIALVVIVVAQQERGDLAAGTLSRWVATVLGELCFGASSSIRRYQWSALLRTRCADALVFLEMAGLVEVSEDSDRAVTCTERGKDILRGVIKDVNEVGSLARDLLRAHSAAKTRGLLLL